eukprot:11410622-Alexandrium_andersonii.AAC.1
MCGFKCGRAASAGKVSQRFPARPFPAPTGGPPPPRWLLRTPEALFEGGPGGGGPRALPIRAGR